MLIQVAIIFTCLEGVTLDECISLCEANADCNAIESDASNDGESFCWMWLNGSCNLRADDVGSVPGLLVWDENLDSSGFGAAGLHHQPNSVESLCASDLSLWAVGGATLEGSQVGDCRNTRLFFK